MRRKVAGFLGLFILAGVMFIGFFLALVIIPAPGPSAEQLAAQVAGQGAVQFSGTLTLKAGEVDDRHQFQARLTEQELSLDFGAEDFRWSFAAGRLELGGQKLPFAPQGVRVSQSQLESRSYLGPEIAGEPTWKLELSGPLVEGRKRISPLLAPDRLVFYFPREGSLPLRATGRWIIAPKILNRLGGQVSDPLEIEMTTGGWKVQKGL